MYETLGGIDLDINEIKELVSQFDQSSLTEFDLREGQFELYMNKNESSRGVNASLPILAASENEQVAQKLTQSDSQMPVVKQETVQIQQETFKGIEVKSPIVGIVYLQSAPDNPPFKSVGDNVAKGEVICIIEAMKLMNEITSEVDGKIVDILVENETVVEYGQPLIRIQPN